ncbi:MAG: LON peptidase substrate-binding domain-containing protein [Holosporales bacterium]|jgi:Lon protease-like protein|nr:LON peptidase substrate-binding domain-containing protein [Holosporales bacterium]
MGLMLTKSVDELPSVLQIIPLRGGILLPRSELQIPVNEVGSVASVISILQASNIVGVVQTDDENTENKPCAASDESFSMASAEKSFEKKSDPIFKCGCVGKLMDIQDVGDVGLVLSVVGICRFQIEKEFDFDGQYRKAIVSYKKYEADIVQEADFPVDRGRLLNTLKMYCKKVNMFLPNFKDLRDFSNERLITMLMMVCPFDGKEKQALLETVAYKEQSELITFIMEMYMSGGASPSSLYH